MEINIIITCVLWQADFLDTLRFINPFLVDEKSAELIVVHRLEFQVASTRNVHSSTFCSIGVVKNGLE